jgi:Flp pilus assembly protein TadG
VKAFQDDGGSIAVTTMVLLPMLLVVVAGVLQLGALRVAANRVRAAADLATLVAVNDQDELELSRSGALRLSADAADVCREYFARQLELSAPLLAGPADRIASSADIVAFPDGSAFDPRTGRRYERPAVRIAAEVPLRTPVFGALVFSPITTVSVLTVSSPR